MYPNVICNNVGEAGGQANQLLKGGIFLMHLTLSMSIFNKNNPIGQDTICGMFQTKRPHILLDYRVLEFHRTSPMKFFA